jgi:Ca2+-transporting ATPase
MAKQALRVIALAYKEVSPDKQELTEEDEVDFTFIALIGMIDPPREGVKDSIQKCKKAGIRVIMITGDNKLTALAIAKELEITEKDEAMDGVEISKVSDEDFKKRLKKINVYARVSPEHKVRIVKLLKEMGEIVAVTGDGVNDAPALKNSDIGVAMGITGTEVTKEAADMVLLDDNFSTIVSAVEGGRGTFDNIKKYLAYLLSTNVGEILVIFTAGLVGFPLPLIAIQILWINLVTDGLPALALGVDPPEPDVMDRPPQSPKASAFDIWVKSIIFVIGIVMAIITLLIFLMYLDEYDLVRAQTMVFSIMVVFELLLSFNCRSLKYSLLKVNPFKNKYLILAVISSFLLLLIVIYTPVLNDIFSTTALNLKDWLIIIVASLSAILGMEVTKTTLRHFK